MNKVLDNRKKLTHELRNDPKKIGYSGMNDKEVVDAMVDNGVVARLGFFRIQTYLIVDKDGAPILDENGSPVTGTRKIEDIVREDHIKRFR